MELKLTKQSNIPASVISKLGKNLHNQKNHPIEIVKRKIYETFL